MELERPAVSHFRFRCPECSQTMNVDEDQALARESIICICGYAATGYIQPLIRTNENFEDDQQFEIIKKMKLGLGECSGCSAPWDSKRQGTHQSGTRQHP